MGKCQVKRAFENGGAVSKADQLIAEMAAKYGVSSQPQAAPVQQPAPQLQPAPQPLPQQQGITSGIVGILKGRAAQIDKAAGYAEGGKPGGGIIAGPGTAKSDSIPARVKETGEQIAVSNTERILSAEQDGFLENVAKNSGYEGLDAMLEDGTGKPVGPVIKAGKRAAADGLSPDEEKNRIQVFGQAPPTLGTGLNGMTRTNPDINFVTGSAPGIAPPPQTGRDASGIITADTAKSAMAEPMQRSGGISGSIDMAGVNGILARENKARGEMIDGMIKANGGNGVAILPDRTDEINQQMVLNKLSPEERAKFELGKMANDAAIAHQGITTRGQDLNFMNDMQRNQIALRGQDINAASDAARTGILRTTKEEELGQKKAASDAGVSLYLENNPNATKPQLDAVRSGILKAVPESDKSAPAEVKLAGAFVAAGLAKSQADGLKMATQSKSDSPEKIRAEVYGKALVANMGNAAAAEKATDGAMKYLFPPAAAAPVPPGFTAVGTAGGKRVLQDAQGKRFVEGN